MSTRNWVLGGALAVCVGVFAAGCMMESGSSRAIRVSEAPGSSTSSASQTSPRSSTSPMSSASTSAVSSAEASTLASPSQTAPPATTAAAIQEVDACMPSRLRIDYEEIRVDVNVATTHVDNMLDPPGGDVNAGNVFLIEGAGVLPASETQNSTFIGGHSWQNLPEGRLPRPFTQLSNRAVKGEDASKASADVRGTVTRPVTSLDGLKVVLECADATLEYTLKEAFVVAKPDLMRVQRVFNDDPGSVEAGNPSILPNRLVVVTCAADEQVGDKDDSVVLFLYLSGAAPK